MFKIHPHLQLANCSESYLCLPPLCLRLERVEADAGVYPGQQVTCWWARERLSSAWRVQHQQSFHTLVMASKPGFTCSPDPNRRQEGRWRSSVHMGPARACTAHMTPREQLLAETQQWHTRVDVKQVHTGMGKTMGKSSCWSCSARLGERGWHQ